MRQELAFTYDEEMRPVAARCTACGDHLLPPPPNIISAVEIIMWFSRRFQEHLQTKPHPALPSHD